MNNHERYISYYDDEQELEGFCVTPKAHHKGAAVLIIHDWSGRTKPFLERAQQLAELGYTAFAIDMFGKGQFGETKEEKSALIQPLVSDRQKLQARMHAALDTLKSAIPEIDPNRIGTMGFCFGGLCALDLARTGADIAATISVHGLFAPPDNLKTIRIKGQVLALHGYLDKMVPAEAMLAFCDEMNQAQVNWQLDVYGNAMHAFTNTQANDPALGTVYQPVAAKRSWQASVAFLDEVLNH